MGLLRYQRIIAMLIRDATSIGSAVFAGFLLLFILALQEMQLFWQLLFSILFTFGIVVVIRLIYFKDRPKKQTFGNFAERIDASSFPSLHSARIVVISLLLISFAQKASITWLLIIIILLVIYSRIYLKKHDWLDVSAGAVLGAITYWLALFLF